MISEGDSGSGSGGDAPKRKPPSKKTRKKISESNTGQKRTEETRRKMSEAQKKRYEDPEERRKISVGNKGKVISEEQRRKISEVHKGRPQDPETRRKMSEAHEGKKHSAKTRIKMSEAAKRRHGTDPATPTGREVTCVIIKKHHESLVKDPEHLTTQFLQNIIGIGCKKDKKFMK